MELSLELALDFFCRSDRLAGGRGFEDIHVLRMEERHHCEYASLMEKKVQPQRGSVEAMEQQDLSNCSSPLDSSMMHDMMILCCPLIPLYVTLRCLQIAGC